jgi:broad specificity phosphatase PhoE
LCYKEKDYFTELKAAMKNYLPILCLLFLLSSCSTSIYLVRHAEKQTSTGNMMGNDPDLTLEGRIRADILADTLTGKKISGVYSTNYQRTRHTAAPTAMIKITDVKIYSDGNKLLDSLITRKKKGYLVVGHSNTIPAMLKHIGLQPSMEDIPENDYDNLFVVRIHWAFGRTIKLTEKTYGKPSP